MWTPRQQRARPTPPRTLKSLPPTPPLAHQVPRHTHLGGSNLGQDHTWAYHAAHAGLWPQPWYSAMARAQNPLAPYSSKSQSSPSSPSWNELIIFCWAIMSMPPERCRSRASRSACLCCSRAREASCCRSCAARRARSCSSRAVCCCWRCCCCLACASRSWVCLVCWKLCHMPPPGAAPPPPPSPPSESPSLSQSSSTSLGRPAPSAASAPRSSRTLCNSCSVRDCAACIPAIQEAAPFFCCPAAFFLGRAVALHVSR
mmetsp:Transcript_41777/g.83841  ORF Transcript_41777/g.83841 Transcript_41777/m.83841 type:complete len:258 (+) Transcript_41777:344-1117(+)